MTKDKYPMYGLAIVAGGAVAIWAGVPPLFLVFLACPLMMFFMMSGMHGGHDETGASGVDDNKATNTHLDGSHERIDRP